MPESSDKSSGVATITLCVLIILSLLLVAYPLSTGPLIWLTEQGYLQQDPDILAFYRPLNWVVNRLPWFQDALNAYMDLWGTLD